MLRTIGYSQASVRRVAGRHMRGVEPPGPNRPGRPPPVRPESSTRVAIRALAGPGASAHDDDGSNGGCRRYPAAERDPFPEGDSPRA